MKVQVLITILLLAFGAFSQEWRDSLTVARKAYKDGEYPKALRYYRSAQKKAPDNIDLSDEIGQSAYKAREFKQAESVFQQESASKKTAADRARVYHNMGNSRMQQKNYQGAIESYKEALRNDPSDEETRYNLSEAIRQLKSQQQQQQKDQDQKQNQNQDQDQNQDQKQDQKNQQKNPNNKAEQKGQNKQNENKQQNNSGSKIPNRSVERLLDQLMKQEAETKRKIGGSKDQTAGTGSGKDW